MPAATMFPIIAPLICAVALALHAAPAAAGQADIFVGERDAHALQGYDPVAYFTLGEAMLGDPNISAEWKGASWLFASEANRTAFLAKPELFAPQYGGYCAFALSRGALTNGDARHWKVIDGRLYLNFNARTQTLWEKDTAAHISAADAYWPKVLNRP